MTPSSPHPSQKPRPSASSWIARSVATLLGRKKKSPPAPEKPGSKLPPVAPTKAETDLLPRFDGLSPERILVPLSPAECAAAAEEIVAAGVAGFDTEAKPTFRAGQKSDGPHVVQFALTNKAFIFQLHRPECQKTAAELIASDRVLKVGFGLRNDHGQIRSRLGVQLSHVLDLDHVFRKKGYRGQIGVRGAMGALLGLNFPKSKSITTSNWSAPELTPGQLRYAANDAFAALKIMEALGLQPGDFADDAPPKQPAARRARRRR